MVKLLGKRTLKETMEHFSELQLPHKISGTPVGIYSYPMFAFGLWEAKPGTGYSHEDVDIESSRKLRTLMSGQRKIFDKSRVKSECRGASPTV